MVCVELYNKLYYHFYSVLIYIFLMLIIQDGPMKSLSQNSGNIMCVYMCKKRKLFECALFLYVAYNLSKPRKNQTVQIFRPIKVNK